jgi:hypothetical protein
MKAIQITFILISYGNALGIKYANYNELCLNVELKKMRIFLYFAE